MKKKTTKKRIMRKTKTKIKIKTNSFGGASLEQTNENNEQQKNNVESLKPSSLKIIKDTKSNFSFHKKSNDSPIYNSYIYDFNVNNCKYYKLINNKFKYIVIKNKDEQQQEQWSILNLSEGDDNIPDDVYNLLHKIDPNFLLSVKGEYKKFTIIRELSESFITTFLNVDKCPKNIDLSDAKIKISEINETLKNKCDNYQIELDYVFNMKKENITSFNPLRPLSLLLCINNNENCVSSIEIKINHDKNHISIDSETHNDFKGKKLNKILRAIIIIIAKKLDSNLSFLTSVAINPISAWLLLEHFNASIYDKDDNLYDINPTTYEDMELIIENSEDEAIFLKIDLNEQNNTDKANTVLVETIEEGLAC
jgi:hypothetical protein